MAVTRHNGLEEDELGAFVYYDEFLEIDRAYMESIKELESEVARLKDWKESMLEVERTWDVQVVGKEIGVPWGSGIREHILPAIIRLKSENAALRAENDRLSTFVTDQNGVIAHLHKEIDKLRAEVDKLNNRLLEIHRECGEANVGIVSASPIDAIRHLRTELEALKIQLTAADKGLLHPSDPKSGWQGISKECKLWELRAENAEADLAAAVELLKKRTFDNCKCEQCIEARALLARLEVGP